LRTALRSFGSKFSGAAGTEERNTLTWEHLAAKRDVFAYFKHEETPEGALYAVDMLGSAGRSKE
jgi:hypothetical protein